MVNWLGIEDVAEVPSRVWLSREKETEEWKPLRKVDCKALNEKKNPEDGQPVLIEYGRATADLDVGVIKYNYYPKAVQELISATWFIRLEDPKDKQRHILEPITNVPMAMAIEELYQQAVHAASSLGDGIDSILKEQIPVSEDHHVAVQRSSDGHYVLRKVPNSWFRGRTYDLQRGYGSYALPGEEEEAQLGPVTHLIFVVHGIGEAMWSREDVTFTGSLVEDITNYRLIMQKRQVAEWRKECENAQKDRRPTPPPPDRVELIPILWYDRLHSSSSSLMKSLKATTLTTIPALREIANDVIFDVLMYLTPNFCYDVLECVTDQIIQLDSVFQKNNPNFLSRGGKSSLMGHSLGSVICWDLLSILHDYRSDEKSSSAAMEEQEGEHGVHISSDGHAADIGYQSYASEEHADQAKNGSFGPSLPKPMKRVLPFQPHHTIFLGSPIGLFLTLRGAHPVFDAMRDNLPDGPGKPRASPFRLPTSSVHNIFHPSDPVAYRIEPLLLAQGTELDSLPPPLYLTREGEGVRLHVKAKQLGDQIRKSILDKKSSISSFMSVVTDQAQNLLHQMDERNKAESSSSEALKPKAQGEQGTEAPLLFPLAGRTGRLDYQLQPNVIDSEYVSAVLAHSSYFANTDVIDYTIDLTRLRTSQQSTVIDLTDGDTEMAVAII